MGERKEAKRRNSLLYLVLIPRNIHQPNQTLKFTLETFLRRPQKTKLFFGLLVGGGDVGFSLLAVPEKENESEWKHSHTNWQGKQNYESPPTLALYFNVQRHFPIYPRHNHHRHLHCLGSGEFPLNSRLVSIYLLHWMVFTAEKL